MDRNNHIVLPLMVAAVAQSLLTSVLQAAEQPGVLKIGSRRELFVDRYLIDRLEGAVLRLQKPTPREVAIVFDQPWEGNNCGYQTFFQDGNIFRMYYRSGHLDIKTDRDSVERTCYAESRDGIHWVRPQLGLVEFQGSKRNNIIREGFGTHNFVPFKDANPECKPDEKYKAVARDKGGLYAFKSANGIHWSKVSDRPIITKGAFDSQNVAFYDSVRSRYVSFHRGFKDGVRDILTCTSNDFLHWTEPVWLEYPGAPSEQLYLSQVLPYHRAPHIFVGFPNRFVTHRNPKNHIHSGVCDGLFMTSRDGLVFHRWLEAHIRPGFVVERWYARNNRTAWGILETKADIPGTPHQLSIYSSAGYKQGKTCWLRRYTMRIDGFVSVQAPLKGGQLITRAIQFEGQDLVINYSTSAAGSVRVEIQDGRGIPLEGFTVNDCDEIYGDELERVVTWKGSSDIGRLAGQTIRLRFELKDADLFSLQTRQRNR